MPVCARYKAQRYRRCGAHGCRAPGRLYRGHDPHHPYLHAGHRKRREPVNGVNAGPGCQTISAATAGYCIPTALLDTTAANFLNINNTIGVSIPLPNGAQVAKTGGGKYTGVYTTPTDSDEYLGKYDENIGNKDHVGVTYFFIKTASTPSGGGNINWTGNQSAALRRMPTSATFTPSAPASPIRPG
jgi:hypothetical protein